jgi:hypothetical protein
MQLGNSFALEPIADVNGCSQADAIPRNCVVGLGHGLQSDIGGGCIEPRSPREGLLRLTDQRLDEEWDRMQRKVRGLAWQIQIGAAVICLLIPERTMGQAAPPPLTAPGRTQNTIGMMSIWTAASGVVKDVLVHEGEEGLSNGRMGRAPS